MALTNEQVRKLAEHLMGTAGSLPSAFGVLFEDLDEDDMSLENCRALDDLVLECHECGWWCCSEDMAERELCEECAEEQD